MVTCLLVSQLVYEQLGFGADELGQVGTMTSLATDLMKLVRRVIRLALKLINSVRVGTMTSLATDLMKLVSWVL
jgi:hypothetical protein